MALRGDRPRSCLTSGALSGVLTGNDHKKTGFSRTPCGCCVSYPPDTRADSADWQNLPHPGLTVCALGMVKLSQVKAET